MITLRISVLALAASLAAQPAFAESSHLSAEQSKTIDSIRTRVLAYSSSLPNFICTQVTHRDSSRAVALVTSEDGIQDPLHGVSDTIVEKVTYFHQKEQYQLLSIDGRPAGDSSGSHAYGATSGGEFGTALRVIFLPATGTEFSFHHEARLHDHRVLVIDFRVPKSAGMPILDRKSGKVAVVPYRGSLYVDALTLDVLRYTTEFKPPSNFPIQRAYRVVDYGPATIAGRPYILPSHAELTMESGPFTFINKIDFTDYHEYKVQATIRYGTLASLPPPQASPATAADTPAESTPAPAQQAASPAAEPAPQPTVTSRYTAPPPPINSIDQVQPGSTPQAQLSVSQPASALASALASGTAPAAAPSVAPAKSSTADHPQPPPSPATPSFGLKVNSDLVLVPVVVRDDSGHAVPNLTRDDFEIYDKGKRQQIADFSAETLDNQPSGAPSSGAAPSSPQAQAAPSAATFLVYVFDDLHLNIEELVRTRNAVQQQLATLPPTYHVAVLSTSGLVEQTFTPDLQKIRDALARLKAQPLGNSSRGRCPNIGPYAATMLVADGSLDGHGPKGQLLTAEIAETMGCLALTPNMPYAGRIALETLQQTAHGVIAQSEQQSREALLELRDVIHWIAPAPGRKVVILISRGFLLSDTAQFDASDLFDQALRHQVVINTLDARGVYAQDAAGNIEDPGHDPELSAVTNEVNTQEAIAFTGVLGSIADGTGGIVVRNTNDFSAGLQRLAAPPQTTYLLAFEPEHLKLNGSFHPLTIKLKSGKHLTIQARRGYFALKQK